MRSVAFLGRLCGNPKSYLNIIQVKYDAKNQSLAPGVRMTGAQEQGVGGEASRPEDTMDASTKTVLIVEDNELNMKLFHDLLDAHGYRTIQTRDGLEALDLARKHAPDLILMDIQLPEVSGLEVTKWLKEDGDLKQIPVIAVTAFAMKGDEEKIRQGGCEAYISKPISVMKFLETVRKFLR
jgi:two-component system cell cycle response regulator DivK